MARVGGLNGFNNLLYQTKLRAFADELEHKSGRVPLDLSFKGYEKASNVLTSKASQINGKYADIKYKPNEVHSRPYYSHDARIDPTILNAVRNQFVDVSGMLIPNRNLKRKMDTNMTRRPLTSLGVIL